MTGCATAGPVEVVQCKPRATLAYWEEFWLSRGYHITLNNPLPQDTKMHFLGRFNASEPVSDYNPKEIYLVNFGSVAVVIFSDGNCITMLNAYQKRVVDYWLSNIKLKKPAPTGQGV